MKRVHADNADAILYISHTGKIVVQRGVLQHDVACLDDTFDRDRWRANSKVSNQRSSCLSRFVRIRSHVSPFFPRWAKAFSMRSRIWALPRGVTLSSESTNIPT